MLEANKGLRAKTVLRRGLRGCASPTQPEVGVCHSEVCPDAPSRPGSCGSRLGTVVSRLLRIGCDSAPVSAGMFDQGGAAWRWATKRFPDRPTCRCRQLAGSEGVVVLCAVGRPSLEPEGIPELSDAPQDVGRFSYDNRRGRGAPSLPLGPLVSAWVAPSSGAAKPVPPLSLSCPAHRKVWFRWGQPFYSGFRAFDSESHPAWRARSASFNALEHLFAPASRLAFRVRFVRLGISGFDGSDLQGFACVHR